MHHFTSQLLMNCQMECMNLAKVKERAGLTESIIIVKLFFNHLTFIHLDYIWLDLL